MMNRTTFLSTKALYCFLCIVFQCDIGMIYDELNHTLINKGIVLFSLYCVSV